MVSFMVWDHVAQVRFLHRRPSNATVAERPNARDCKSRKPLVQIQSVAPILKVPYDWLFYNIFCSVFYRHHLHLLFEISAKQQHMEGKFLGHCGYSNSQHCCDQLHRESLDVDTIIAGCICWHMVRNEVQNKRIMEDDAAGLVLRLALKTRFS